MQVLQVYTTNYGTATYFGSGLSESKYGDKLINNYIIRIVIYATIKSAIQTTQDPASVLIKRLCAQGLLGTTGLGAISLH